MKNLLDYVANVGQTLFSEKSLTSLDFALFNELSYLSIFEYLPNDLKLAESLVIHDLALLFQQYDQDIQFTFLNTKERIDLLKMVLESKRYQHVMINHYVNDINAEFERQFAAMVFSIPEENTHQLVFRGTDDSLIGWKEDFKLTYMREIPAQRAASIYLKEILPTLSGQVLVSGHSKGGNLAVYAAAHLPIELQDKIALIYMYDAPGFRQNFLQSQGYLAIRSKIVAMKPFESVVGVMLESDRKPIIVASKDRGMGQHPMLNWSIDADKNEFETVTQLSPMSRKLEKTFAIWNKSLSHYELKNLFDLLFDQLIASGVTSLNDFSAKKPLGVAKYFEVYRRLSPKQKRVFTRALHLFIQAYRSNAVNPRKANLTSMLTKWQRERD
ncbi:Mbeg1-like protein [Streptococcus halotolerans]|uniref:Mbeg1-like protein n=1 Tax=Streptococcus halotolerans TaxID=1814128 RepID=UPI000786B606|nr:Mbeg1-like protein [Streptococcus halotolerans]